MRQRRNDRRIRDIRFQRWLRNPHPGLSLSISTFPADDLRRHYEPDNRVIRISVHYHWHRWLEWSTKTRKKSYMHEIKRFLKKHRNNFLKLKIKNYKWFNKSKNDFQSNFLEFFFFGSLIPHRKAERESNNRLDKQQKGAKNGLVFALIGSNNFTAFSTSFGMKLKSRSTQDKVSIEKITVETSSKPSTPSTQDKSKTLARCVSICTSRRLRCFSISFCTSKVHFHGQNFRFVITFPNPIFRMDNSPNKLFP